MAAYQASRMPRITGQHEGIRANPNFRTFPNALDNPNFQTIPNALDYSRGGRRNDGMAPVKKQTSTKVGNTTTTTTHQPGTPPAPTAPQPVTPDPRDAQYFENLAKLQFQRNQRISDLNAQGANDLANTNYRLGGMARQHPVDIRNQRIAFNRRGLFESGQLGQGLGGLETKYAASRGQLNSLLAQRNDARSRSIASANETFTQGSTSELEAARARAAKALLANPPASNPGDDYAAAVYRAALAQQARGTPARAVPPARDQAPRGQPARNVHTFPPSLDEPRYGLPRGTSRGPTRKRVTR